MRYWFGLILTLVFVVMSSDQLAAQPTIVDILPDNLEVTFEDGFDGSGMVDSWVIWDHFPQVHDGQIIIQGWKSWSDAIVRPNIGQSTGVMQRFQYESGAMEFFLDYGNFDDASYRNVRLGTSGDNNWHLYASHGAKGVQTRTYGSARLAPDTWYNLLFLIGSEGQFYIQVWAQDDMTTLVFNAELLPSGSGWSNSGWWFGNKVYDGTLTVDQFTELRLTENYMPPCTLRSVGSVNLRSGPGINHDRVGRMDPEYLVCAIDQTMDDAGFTWWQLPDKSWVRADVIRETSVCAIIFP